MRIAFLLMTMVAGLIFGGSANGSLVVGYVLDGTSSGPFENFTSTNALATSSSGTVLDLSSSNIDVFSGSFSTGGSTKLNTFEFAYETPVQTIPSSFYQLQFSSNSNATVVTSGSLVTSSTLPSRGVVEFDLTSLNAVTSGSFSLFINNADFRNSTGSLPATAFSGFAAISGTSIAAVPEPSSICLSIIGLGTLGAIRYRRKNISRD